MYTEATTGRKETHMATISKQAMVSGEALQQVIASMESQQCCFSNFLAYIFHVTNLAAGLSQTITDAGAAVYAILPPFSVATCLTLMVLGYRSVAKQLLGCV